MPVVFIDNVPYNVKAGKNLLETSLALGFDLPYFCWHPALGSVGACRQCAVKVFRDEKDGQGRLIMSCMEEVKEGLRFSINDTSAKSFREQVIEWLMTNHPHDCPVCDEGGSCHLQDMTVMTGHNYRRFQFRKRTYKNQYLGPLIHHEMNRCIQCYRCVRYYRDYAGGDDLNVFAAHNHVYFGREADGVLESPFSGNLAEVCPTGVFTDKTLKDHYTRKWDLTMAPSVCQHCSMGCNTIAGERYGSLRCIQNRYNGEVNGYFICDRGRFGYEFVNSENRITTPILRNRLNEAASETELLHYLEVTLSSGVLVGIGSPRASMESNFALRQLVGEENFFQGITEDDSFLIRKVSGMLETGSVHCASMKEIEQSDAVIVLGEDIWNTAPRMALAVMQAVKRTAAADAAAQLKIPSWNDAAINEFVQDERGYLANISVRSSKLDEVASANVRMLPDDAARFAFAIANQLDSSQIAITDLPEATVENIKAIADVLTKSKRPVIISGLSNRNEGLLKAAYNLCAVLKSLGKQSSLAFVLPECNSMGLGLMHAGSITSATDRLKKNPDATVIVIENDLFRNIPADEAEEFFKHCKRLVVFDSLFNRTTEMAEAVIPVATFAEADGTILNYEGRAQRYSQVYVPTNSFIRETWKWLRSMQHLRLRVSNGHAHHPNELLAELESSLPQFWGIRKVAPDPQFSIHGEKIPREPHRYSGRTAMLANRNVSEPKPLQDGDSALTFTMEGFRGMPPPPLIPFFWAPGWNSVQSVAKYQDEPGGALKGGDPGVKLFKSNGAAPVYFKDPPESFKPRPHKWLVLPQYHVLGSGELSSYTEGLRELTPEPFVVLSESDATQMGVKEHSIMKLTAGNAVFKFSLHIQQDLSPGVVLVSAGLPGTEALNWDGWVKVEGDTLKI